MSGPCEQVSGLEASAQSGGALEQQELAKDLAAKEEALAARDQELVRGVAFGGAGLWRGV